LTLSAFPPPGCDLKVVPWRWWGSPASPPASYGVTQRPRGLLPGPRRGIEAVQGPRSAVDEVARALGTGRPSPPTISVLEPG
jgi:hypothetical protein